MNLAALQALFAEALVRPQSLIEAPGWPPRAEACFRGSATLTPLGQIDVYREQFWLRHVHCLAEDFPTLQALVGHVRFHTLVEGYLAAHPPVDFQLRVLGAKLATWLEDTNEPMLADVARVEWAYIDAFDAADAPPLDPRDVQAIAPDGWPLVTLAFHPSLQLLALGHPAHETRAAQKAGEPVREPPVRSTHLGVYRRDLLLYTEEMDAIAFALAKRLHEGEPLGAAGDAVAQASGSPDIVEANIAAWFTRWSSLGWITRVVT